MQPIMLASDANGRDARKRGSKVPCRTRGSASLPDAQERFLPNSIGEIPENGLKTFSLRIHRYDGEETSLIFQ
jgi:hypothetical protein